MNFGREILPYTLETEDGERVVLSLLNAEVAFARGFCIEAIVGFVCEGADLDDWTPADFQENPAFVRFLSRIVYEHINEVPGIRLKARTLESGYVYLIDRRAADPDGRLPPEDIIGEVRVEAGAIVNGSFQHNRRHRLFTNRGFFRLPDELEVVLDRKLRARAAEQSSR